MRLQILPDNGVCHKVAAVETLKRNQVIFKDPEEKADVSKKLKEEETALENIRSNIIDLDDLLRQIVTLYVADKGKNKLCILSAIQKCCLVNCQ